MLVTIDIKDELAQELVRWMRLMDRKGFELTGLRVYEGEEDGIVLAAAVRRMVKEGLAWEKDRYGEIVGDTAERETCGAE